MPALLEVAPAPFSICSQAVAVHVGRHLNPRCAKPFQQRLRCVQQSDRGRREPSPSVDVPNKQVGQNLLRQVTEHPDCPGRMLLHGRECCLKSLQALGRSAAKSFELLGRRRIASVTSGVLAGHHGLNESCEFVGIGKVEVTDLKAKLFEYCLGEPSVHLDEEGHVHRLEREESLVIASIGEPTEPVALLMEPSRNLRSRPLIAASQSVGVCLGLAALTQAALYRGEFALDLLQTRLRLVDGLLGPFRPAPVVSPSQDPANALLKVVLVLA